MARLHSGTVARCRGGVVAQRHRAHVFPYKNLIQLIRITRLRFAENIFLTTGKYLLLVRTVANETSYHEKQFSGSMRENKNIRYKQKYYKY